MKPFILLFPKSLRALEKLPTDLRSISLNVDANATIAFILSTTAWIDVDSTSDIVDINLDIPLPIASRYAVIAKESLIFILLNSFINFTMLLTISDEVVNMSVSPATNFILAINPEIPNPNKGNFDAKVGRSFSPTNLPSKPPEFGISFATVANFFIALQAASTEPELSWVIPLSISVFIKPAIPFPNTGILAPNFCISFSPTNLPSNPPELGISSAVFAIFFNALHATLTVSKLSLVNEPIFNSLTNATNPVANVPKCNANLLASFSPTNLPSNPPEFGIVDAASDIIFNASAAILTLSTFLIFLVLSANLPKPSPNVLKLSPNFEKFFLPKNGIESNNLEAVRDNIAFDKFFIDLATSGLIVEAIIINGVNDIINADSSLPKLTRLNLPDNIVAIFVINSEAAINNIDAVKEPILPRSPSSINLDPTKNGVNAIINPDKALPKAGNNVSICLPNPATIAPTNEPIPFPIATNIGIPDSINLAASGTFSFKVAKSANTTVKAPINAISDPIPTKAAGPAKPIILKAPNTAVNANSISANDFTITIV